VPVRTSFRVVALVATLTAMVVAQRAAVLQTIQIDGDMSDWAAVLADPFQSSSDGPAGGLADADGPVQSTGRDLLAFAWTWDASYLYLYASRVASSSNRQEFYFYADTNENGYMESGEPVVGVSWWGKTRVTEVSLYSYAAAAAGGDPMGSPAGSADGWTLPGSLTGGTVLERVNGGAANGVEMEARVSWTALGVPSGTPIRFHVSSSNSSNVPDQIDDNMGGPGGSVGTTRFGGVIIRPDVATTVVPAGLAVMAHTVTNSGSAPDAVDLSWSASGSFTPSGVGFYRDVNGDGLLDAGDLPLADTTGDGLPDTGLIAAGGVLSILAAADAPAAVTDGQVCSLTITARSDGVPTQSDTATDTITVAAPTMTLVKSVSSAVAAPGDLLTYNVTYTSNGTASSHNVVLVDTVPQPTVYVPGSAVGAGTVITFSHDGGVTFDALETAPVTNIRWTFPSPLAPGATGSVAFQVQVP